jgi:MoxR-like ATPase
MGYPSANAEMAMLDTHAGHDPLDSLEPVLDSETLVSVQHQVREVFVSAAVRRYVSDLVTATRTSPDLRLGASPRSALHLVRAAKAAAAINGRDHVLPDDIKALAVPVLTHRLLITAEAAVARRSAGEVVTDLLSRVPVAM